MKNMRKVLGIIAMIAVIGLFVGCGEASEEDQTKITITGIPDNFNGLYAQIAVSEKIDGKDIISAGFAKEIAGGQVTGAQRDEDGAVVTKEGYVVLIISTDTSDGEDVFVGVTESPVTLGKGEYTVEADKFIGTDKKGIAAAAANYKGAPKADSYGTYACYTNLDGTESESINFSKTKFQIFDSTGDTLTFTIDKWEDATTPDTPTGTAAAYPKAYKFTGKITSAQTIPTTGENANKVTEIKSDKVLKANESIGYFRSSNTAPEIVPADLNTTTVWMYLYVKEDTNGNITEFVRSSFNKAGQTGTAAASDTATVGTNSSNTNAKAGFDAESKEYKKPIPKGDTVVLSGLRVYTKL